MLFCVSRSCIVLLHLRGLSTTHGLEWQLTSFEALSVEGEWLFGIQLQCDAHLVSQMEAGGKGAARRRTAFVLGGLSGSRPMDAHVATRD